MRVWIGSRSRIGLIVAGGAVDGIESDGIDDAVRSGNTAIDLPSNPVAMTVILISRSFARRLFQFFFCSFCSRRANLRKDLLFGFKDYYRAFGGGGIPKRLGAGCGGNSLSIMGPGLLPIRMFSIC